MEYIQIGFTRKTHGVKGELKVAIEEPYEDVFLEADRVFLEIRGSKQPFFIESIRGGGDLIVHFEDIPTREDALLLQSKPVFLPADEVPETAPEEEYTLQYGYLTGYRILDKTAGQIGEVRDILELPQQEMAVVEVQGREVLIPLNEQFIQSIDDQKREVHTDLPEGLLEL
ncbi:MAG: 16S rRNA processing protein RimM [Bacteroidetes bacterium]|nr:MAG: 16S rRNA processing protein RimM [Bacteroidota bacterium]